MFNYFCGGSNGFASTDSIILKFAKRILIYSWEFFFRFFSQISYLIKIKNQNLVIICISQWTGFPVFLCLLFLHLSDSFIINITIHSDTKLYKIPLTALKPLRKCKVDAKEQTTHVGVDDYQSNYK